MSEDEFGGMINAAAALPKKFGFDWWQVQFVIAIFIVVIVIVVIIIVVIVIVQCQGSPSDQFKAIDDNGDGAVSFDEWLSFAYKNYQVGFRGHLVSDRNGK